MKIFIAVSCLLAVATASYYPSYASYHVPVIGPHGVPVDEPAVQHARAEHLAAHHEASLRSGHGYEASPGHYGSHDGGHHGYATHYHGPLHYPKIGHTGVPIDEPAVQSARAHHLAAVAAVQSHHGGAGIYNYAAPYGSISHGVPHDTPEVAHAKAAHFAAHAEAQARNGGLVHYRKRRSVYGGHHVHVPVIGPHGVPQDEPAVAHLKAKHAAAHAEAAHRIGHVQDYAPHSHHSEHHGHYTGPLHYPVIGHNGVPVDTPEVQAARAHHAAAHHEAQSHAGYSHLHSAAPSW